MKFGTDLRAYRGRRWLPIWRRGWPLQLQHRLHPRAFERTVFAEKGIGQGLASCYSGCHLATGTSISTLHHPFDTPVQPRRQLEGTPKLTLDLGMR